MAGLTYKVIHHPDGGEATEIARFMCKGDAYDFARGKVDDPRNDIRSMEVVLVKGRKREVLFRFGWAHEAGHHSRPRQPRRFPCRTIKKNIRNNIRALLGPESRL